MIDAYYIPPTRVEAVKWNNSSEEYDLNLYNLGKGHDEFIVANPEFEWCQFYKNIKSLPLLKSDRCIVWMLNGKWVAKYFTKNWIVEKKYLEVELIVEWERNPDINSNIIFNTPVIEDLYDLNYQLTWYVDSKFNPTQDQVWIYKCKLAHHDVKGTKDMGSIGPVITYNPAISNLNYSINEKVPYYDLVYEHVWMIDESLAGVKDVWGAKITPQNSKGTKVVGNINISLPKRMDVVFISYHEQNAEKNWQRVLEKAPYAKRVDGVEGIAEAHKRAAELSTTDMFYVIDGDAWLVDDFDFTFQPTVFDRDCVHVWQSINPINKLTYGYGGVKLLPKDLTYNISTDKLDITTSISQKFKPVKKVSNITKFNTNEFNTFRSAFRECAKLSSEVLTRQLARESKKRLETWCTVGADALYGEWAIKGAIAGREFGQTYSNNLKELARINDYTWLQEQFNISCNLHNK